MNLRPYVVQEGNAFRLLPVKNPNPNRMLVNSEIMYDNMMNNFSYRELNNPDVYYNQDYRNFVLNHRSSFNVLAQTLFNEGEKEKAKEVVMRSLELIPDEAIEYDFFNVPQVELLLRLDEVEKAKEMADIIAERADKIVGYNMQNGSTASYQLRLYSQTLSQISQAFRKNGKTEEAKKYNDILNKHLKR